jgi:hypothetical protein
VTVSILDRALLQEPLMTSKEFIGPDDLTAADREILSQGLDSLLRERSVAYEIAVKVALSRGLDRPNVTDFGLPDILRLSRLIQTQFCFASAAQESLAANI